MSGISRSPADVEGEAHAARADLLRRRRPWRSASDGRASPSPSGSAWLKSTSSGVMGVPSEKRASGRRWKVMELRSSGISTLSRDQPVEGERLVAAARHQALVDVLAHAGRGDAPDDEGVEAVEGAERAQHEAAALGRVGIDVGKVREARRRAWACRAWRARATGSAAGRGTEQHAAKQERSGEHPVRHFAQGDGSQGHPASGAAVGTVHRYRETTNMPWLRAGLQAPGSQRCRVATQQSGAGWRSRLMP